MMKAESTDKKQRGRPFKPGQSGNPKGRPPGALNKTTLAIRALMAGQAEAVLQVLIDQAMGGDVAAARAILERLVPVARETPVDAGAVDLPELSAATLPAAVGAVVSAVASGSITPGQGEKLVAMLQGFGRAVELQEIEQRIAALEAGAGGE
ncbi:hypothetical protein MASR1M90_23530 [Desulfovibrionales bacterium]